MTGLLMLIHIVASILLIIIVLLQSGKSADLAGAFGGTGSQSTFGPRGAASILSKMTTTLAILFMVTSLLLYITAANRESTQSVMSKEIPQVEKPIENKQPQDKKEAAQPEPDAKKAATEKTDPDAVNKDASDKTKTASPVK